MIRLVFMIIFIWI